ncbi:MAG: DHHA2 domain-containing protein [Patescibacteria group bacterium]
MIRSTTILVTCYVNPDLDGFASAVAYAEFLNLHGRTAQTGILGEPHAEAKYVVDRFKLAPPPEIANADDFTAVILVDASDLNGLEGRVPPQKVIEIIDHRPVNETEKFTRAKVQIELVGAAATLIAEKFQSTGSAVSPAAAILLYSAIISNTLNFQASITTERDREMAAWLRQFVGVADDYWRELFIAKSDLSGSKLAKQIRSDFAWFVLEGKRIGVAQLEIIGAEQLISGRLPEIIAELGRLKADLNLDYVFQNTIELEQTGNYLVALDRATEKILTRALNLQFSNQVAKRQKLIMRKQIMPLIKAELENKRFIF